MPDAVEILMGLRPAHLPPASATLSAADLLLPLTFGLMAALLLSLLWPTRIKGRRRIALTALDELKAARMLAPGEARVAQARLLRRVVREADGGAAAELPGAAFAAHLDKRFSTDFFTAGAGKAVTLSLYAPDGEGASPRSGGGATPANDEVGAMLETLLSKMKA